MYEQYIGKKVRLISLEYPRIYDFEGHHIDFNDDMVRTIKNNSFVEVIGEITLSDGVVLMKARFSDCQVWMIIPEWIADSGVALFV